jgi:large subunit ribosomal protein L1
MQKVSKRQIENKKQIIESIYSVDEAIKLLKQTSTAKFIESVELHANLKIDPKYADQQLRTTVTLPHGTGNNIRIAVVTSEAKISEAKNVGADIYGSNTLIDDITKGIINFDLLIATPDMMPKLAKLGRILGPKGLMPSPKAGTVTTELTKTLNDFKKGKFEYKADKYGIVHINFGKSNFSNLELKDNLITLYNSIEQNRPSGVKGKYFKKIFICSTMGPSIELDLATFE